MKLRTDDALGVHPAHDVTDGAVLAGGVEGLEHHQHAVGVLGGQPGLVFGDQLDAPLEKLETVLLLDEARFEGGVEVLASVTLEPGFTRSGTISSAMRLASASLAMW